MSWNWFVQTNLRLSLDSFPVTSCSSKDVRTSNYLSGIYNVTYDERDAERPSWTIID